MKSAEERERFIELRAEGRSYEDIAATLGTSKTTLIAWSKELQKEIANARTIALDALFQRFAVAKAKRIEVFGRRLEAILKELDKRDLSDVPTVSLLKLALDYGDRLKAESEPLTMQGEEREVQDWERIVELEKKRDTWPI